MKDLKIYITIIVSLGLGLGLGYFLAISNKSDNSLVKEKAEENTNSSSDQIWTCSMHPQIRQNEPGLCPICEMDLIPLNSNNSDDPLVLNMTAEAVKLADIQTSLISSGKSTNARILNLPGKVQVDERQLYNEVSHVPGRIEKLYISYTGAYVPIGSKLAEIYSPELITAQKELLEANKIAVKNPEILEASISKLKYWKIPQSQIEEILASGTVKESFTIYASNSGTVSKKFVSLGDYLKKGDVLYEMADLSKLWILFDAYEHELSSIDLGDKIEFTSSSVPGKTFKATVSFIDPMIDPTSRTASIRAEINNYRSQLKPEMLVRGILKNNNKTDAVLSVPRSAVMWTGKRSVVYIKLQDTEIPSFEYREIELGERLGDNYIVLQGIEEGEEVVTYGAFTIDAAAQLNNQSSMINRKVGVKKDESETNLNYSADASEEFYSSLEKLVESYIALKDNLVSSDQENSSKSAARFIEILDSIEMTSLSGEGHNYWMQKYNNLKSHGARISSISDLESQRKEFGFLSSELINTLSSFKYKSDVLYVQHCPMAFDNTGADWLSIEDKIRNPYFGDRMMKCGLIKKTFE